jgi:putative DNA primase/helicase
MPFTFKPPQPDKNLKNKLVAEHPAILRWLIDGAADALKNGVGSYARVDAETLLYFETMDTLANWVEENCIVDPTRQERPGTLLRSYNEWAKANGAEQLSNVAFAEAIGRVEGVSRVRSHGSRWTRGIALK